MGVKSGSNLNQAKDAYSCLRCRQRRRAKRGRTAMEHNIEILLVEDTPSDIRLTQEALKRSDLKYTMAVANDGVEAMEYLNDLKASGKRPLPDLILLDLNMPRKNGH